jgi:hypothetical protein
LLNLLASGVACPAHQPTRRNRQTPGPSFGHPTQAVGSPHAQGDARVAVVGPVEAHRQRHQAVNRISTDAPVDSMLDFYNELSAAIRGRMEGANILARINDALRDLFECFYLDKRPEGIVILPVLDGGRIEGPQTFASYAVEGEEIAPPLRAFHAPSGEMANTQEYRPIPSALALPPLLVETAGR